MSNESSTQLVERDTGVDSSLLGLEGGSATVSSIEITLNYVLLDKVRLV